MNELTEAVIDAARLVINELKEDQMNELTEAVIDAARLVINELDDMSDSTVGYEDEDYKRFAPKLLRLAKYLFPNQPEVLKLEALLRSKHLQFRKERKNERRS